MCRSSRPAGWGAFLNAPFKCGRWVPLNRAALAVRLHLRSRGHPASGPLFVTQAGERYNVRDVVSPTYRNDKELSRF